MNRFYFFTTMLLIACVSLNAQDWKDIPVPVANDYSYTWELQENVSDDFNYLYDETNVKTDFGDDKWYNFYHNAWNGPGTTYWQYDHVSVDGSDLILRASRNPSTDKMGVPGVNAACITSNNRVLYPVFVEASVSVADIVLASDVWLLSADDTQEIDIIECYGGKEPGNAWFAKFIHLSHHSFIRNPFTDYQPRDQGSWYSAPSVSGWGEYCWNAGERKYVRVGVNWVSPFHFEYYIDGELVRVVYDKSLATKTGTAWNYGYPTMTDGKLDMDGGYQHIEPHTTSSEFDFSKLEEANNISTTSIIDPYNYQDGNGFTKELDIIINVESQDWHVSAGRTPTDSDLEDPAKNTMKVDWIRVYKPIATSNKENSSDLIKLYPNPAKDIINIDGLEYSDYSVTVSSIHGQTFYKSNLTNIDSINLNIENYPSGVYLVRLSNKNQDKVLKFSKL